MKSVTLPPTDEELDLVSKIPLLFDHIGTTRKYFQEFTGDTGMEDARKFAEAMREKGPALISVEQRNTKVIIEIL